MKNNDLRQKLDEIRKRLSIAESAQIIALVGAIMSCVANVILIIIKYF